MNPFTDQREFQVGHFGERRLIQEMTKWLSDCTPPPPEGIGDDAAVLTTPSKQLAITKDALVYRKHFDEQAPAELAGAKLINRNISDLAAMGAVPSHAVIACLLPPNTSIPWLSQFYSGINQTAKSHNLSIVGGDITSTFNDLAFTLTLLGSIPVRPLTRKSAHPGDTVWVTGHLGGSILGKHLHFKPRLEEGLWLASKTEVTSAMDISDGLATDLLNLCPEDCKIEVQTETIPISEAVENYGDDRSIDHALTDGEDYELLFTLDAKTDQLAFLARWRAEFSIPISCVGAVRSRDKDDESRITYLGESTDFSPKGYEHF
jgi:thiamine-monophosphate kinase